VYLLGDDNMRESILQLIHYCLEGKIAALATLRLATYNLNNIDGAEAERSFQINAPYVITRLIRLLTSSGG
jgi:hypothetical protein